MNQDQSEKLKSPTLPFDVLVSVFQFLDTKSKGNAAQVCTSWKEAANCKKLWKNVKVRLRSGNLCIQSEQSIIERGIGRFNVCTLEPKVIEFLRRVPDLEYLRFMEFSGQQKLSKMLETDADLIEILNETELISRRSWSCVETFLILTSCRCGNNNDSVLKIFTSGMKKLKELYLDGCLCTLSGVSDIKTDLFTDTDTLEQLPSLQKLNLIYFNCLKEEIFGSIGQKFVNLVSLKLEKCRSLSNSGLAHLNQLKMLVSLRLYNTLYITDEGLYHVSQLTNLKTLDIVSSGLITDSGLEIISRLINFVTFNLGTYHEATAVTFRHLHKLSHLRNLGLHSCWISDESLFHLSAGNLKLEKLKISQCSYISDQGILNICQSSFALRELNLAGCEVTDYVVHHIIAKFPRLQVLNLRNCPLVTDETRKLVDIKLRINKIFGAR